MLSHLHSCPQRVCDLKRNDVKSSCDPKYRLPELELKKFNGDIKSFLGFWSQFSRIHEDEEMPSEEKFQYLIQVITHGTRAASLLESFPPVAQNYPKAIELLKERFAGISLREGIT
ncbi:hypothetical protein AVEN_163313-1 [Araneus ventricosus]|uniref:Uncharacterized protein n=1 Tax=Araneus ventricosus TaxID=182803 RepID=A0A4Y2N5E4_ARAVE|nr:hypothetical protein AVEN_163313-1 [Araneus ventricosus]